MSLKRVFLTPRLTHLVIHCSPNSTTTTTSVLLPGPALGRNARQPAQERSPLEEPGACRIALYCRCGGLPCAVYVCQMGVLSVVSSMVASSSSLFLFCIALFILVLRNPFGRVIGRLSAEKGGDGQHRRCLGLVGPAREGGRLSRNPRRVSTSGEREGSEI